MKVCITIDVEQDAPPFLSTYRGIEEGMPLLLDLLEKENIPATFFTTGDTALRYPDIVNRLVASGHELGCHGNKHIRLDKASENEALDDIRTATKTLRRFSDVTSFRAPNLQLPKEYLAELVRLGFKTDSSEAKHKNIFLKVRKECGIKRIPASTSSLFLRTPLKNLILKKLESPVVLFFHPWEFVDLKREKIRFDCRYKTGAESLEILHSVIAHYKKMDAEFVQMRELG